MQSSVLPRLVVCAVLAGASLSAQWSTDPTSNLAVADGGAGQVQPKVVPTSDGGCWISWFDSDPNGSPAFGFDVRVQRLDAGGNEVFAHGGILVADRGFSSTQDYGLSVDTSDNALLAFRDDRFTGTQTTAAKVDGTTGGIVYDVQLTNTTQFIATPMIAGTSDGDAVVGWSSDSDLHLMKLDPSGGNVWANDLVLSPSTNNYGISDLKASDGGSVIVSIVDYGGFTAPRHLLAQKVDKDGNVLWGANPVSVFDSGSLQIGNFPDFVTDGAGGAVFGWYGTGPLESYAQHVLSDGSEAFPHNGVAASTNTSQLRVQPSVDYDPGSGTTYLFYIETNSVQSMFGVSAQAFDGSGNRIWGSTGKSIVALSSAAVIDVKGVALGSTTQLFWIPEPAFAQDQVLGATLDAAGTITAGPFGVSTTPATKSRLAPAVATTGVAVVGFQDNGSGSDDILAQDVLRDGSLGGLASVSSRDGSGTNPVCFTSLSLPVVGTSWDTQVVTTGHPGATFSGVVIYSAPTSGLFLSFGELLVDVTSPLLTSSLLPTSGTDVHSFAVPTSISLVGASASAQALILGGGAELCNALDVVSGL